jgi:hypothetical protein
MSHPGQLRLGTREGDRGEGRFGPKYPLRVRINSAVLGTLDPSAPFQAGQPLSFG